MSSRRDRQAILIHVLSVTYYRYIYIHRVSSKFIHCITGSDPRSVMLLESKGRTVGSLKRKIVIS